MGRIDSSISIKLHGMLWRLEAFLIVLRVKSPVEVENIRPSTIYRKENCHLELQQKNLSDQYDKISVGTASRIPTVKATLDISIVEWGFENGKYK